MNKKTYQEALRYSSKINNKDNYRDYVHRAYLVWFEKTGNDLFDESPFTVCRVIRNLKFNDHTKGTFMSNGEVGNKKIYDIDLVDNPTEMASIPSGDIINKLSSSQEENEEIIEILRSNLSSFDKKVLNLRLKGFTQREIQKKLKTHNVKVTSSIKKIRETMHTNSPFNGSKLKIVKRVKRKDFEKDKEEYLKEYGYEGDWDHNECFEQFPSKADKSIGLLVKESTSD